MVKLEAVQPVLSSFTNLVRLFFYIFFDKFLLKKAVAVKSKDIRLQVFCLPSPERSFPEGFDTVNGATSDKSNFFHNREKCLK